MDVLFIHPNASKEIYQALSNEYSAVEPPIWAALLAKACQVKGFSVELMDCEALHMDDATAIHHMKAMKPKVACFVVYGQQPSASSQNMEGALRLAEKVKQELPEIKTLFVGGHVSALTKELLETRPYVDFACQNEGVYTIINLLRLLRNNSDSHDYRGVDGLAWRSSHGIILNYPSKVVPKEELEADLPGMFWDLLPMKQYRTSLWHALPNNAERQPFAALYTSLGCPFSCTFCCINAPFGGSSFRYWSPEFMIKEFDTIVKMGIKNVKIADEMFVMNPAHFMRLCELIIERGYNLNIWAYARVDITKPQYLETLKKAGVNWLALGIESGNKSVRKGVIKGRFDDVDIKSVVESIRSAGINVIGNYIFGLPDDNFETMQETLDLALEMNTEEANFYSAMAYPGSKLYKEAKETGMQLPQTFSGYSQHSYDCQPMPTKYLQAREVLAFRDMAWQRYHTNPDYLDMVKAKFGERAYNETVRSTKIKLNRRLLGD